MLRMTSGRSFLEPRRRRCRSRGVGGGFFKTGRHLCGVASSFAVSFYRACFRRVSCWRRTRWRRTRWRRPRRRPATIYGVRPRRRICHEHCQCLATTRPARSHPPIPTTHPQNPTPQDHNKNSGIAGTESSWRFVCVVEEICVAGGFGHDQRFGDALKCDQRTNCAKKNC